MRILNISNNYHNSSLWLNMHKTYETLHPGEAFFVSFNRKDTSFDNQLEVYDFPVLDAVDRFLFFRKIGKCFRILDSRKEIVGSFDCIHAHTLFSDGAVAYRMWRTHGIPYIVSIRNTDINTFYRLKPYLKFYADKILSSASYVICLSPAYKDQILSKVSLKIRAAIKKKIVIVPNGIDDYWFDKIYTERRTCDSRKVKLVTTGQISKNKNQITVVKACERLIRNGYDVEYNLVGKVEDENYFALFKDKPFVKYLGVLSKEELCAFYRQCDVFILVSRFETFGLVYAEALTQGLPIIYTKGQGFDCQFPDGKVGFSVPYEDDAVVSSKIVDIVNSYNTLSNNAICMCTKFNVCNVVNELYMLLLASIKKHD